MGKVCWLNCLLYSTYCNLYCNWSNFLWLRLLHNIILIYYGGKKTKRFLDPILVSLYKMRQQCSKFTRAIGGKISLSTEIKRKTKLCEIILVEITKFVQLQLRLSCELELHSINLIMNTVFNIIRINFNRYTNSIIIVGTLTRNVIHLYSFWLFTRREENNFQFLFLQMQGWTTKSDNN